MVLWIDVQGEAKWKEFLLFQTQVESVVLTSDLEGTRRKAMAYHGTQI